MMQIMKKLFVLILCGMCLSCNNDTATPDTKNHTKTQIKAKAKSEAKSEDLFRKVNVFKLRKNHKFIAVSWTGGDNSRMYVTTLDTLRKEYFVTDSGGAETTVFRP
jgi:ribonuclease HI